MPENWSNMATKLGFLSLFTPIPACVRRRSFQDAKSRSNVSMTASFLADGKPSKSCATSAKARAYYERQRENPVFEPTQLDSELRDIFGELQARSPPSFVRVPDLPASVCKERAVAADLLAERRISLCASARREIMIKYANVFNGGQALGNDGRREACWRDINAYTRVLGYLCIAENGLNEKGICVLREVYEDRGLPLEIARLCLDIFLEQAKTDAVYYAKDNGCDPGSVKAVLEQAFAKFRQALED